MNLLAKYKAMVQAPSTPPSISLVVDNSINTEEGGDSTRVAPEEMPKNKGGNPDLQPLNKEQGLGTSAVNIDDHTPPTVKAVWSNPHEKGTPKARRESLHEAMSASFHAATIEGGGMPAGIRSCLVDLESIEKEIEARWRKVIEDNKGVKQFREYLDSTWTPALREANRRLQEGKDYEREERYCIQNENSLTERGEGESLR